MNLPPIPSANMELRSKRLNVSTNDSNNEINKLKVAHHFVESEDQRGTNQVYQRICGMALRGWALQKV